MMRNVSTHENRTICTAFDCFLWVIVVFSVNLGRSSLVARICGEFEAHWLD